MKKILSWVSVLFVSVAIIAVFSISGCKVEDGSVSTAVETPTEEVEEEMEEEAEEAEESSVTLKGMERAIADGKEYAGVTIKVILSGDAALSKFEETTAEFEDATGINVELNIVGWDVLSQQVPIVLGSDTYEYDVVDVHEPYINTYGATDALVDLSEYFAAESEELIPEAMQIVTIGDKMVAMPLIPSWEIMFYNKELVAEVGLDPNKPPETMDEFYEWLVKLSLDTDDDGVIDRYSVIFDFTADWGWIVTHQIFQAFGAEPFEVVDGKAHITFDTPETKEALNFIQRMYDENLIAPSVLTEFQWDVISLYNNGETPLLQMWELYAIYLDEDMIDKTGFFPLPGKEKGTYTTIPGFESLSVHSSSPNQEAAVAFIRYMTSHENTLRRTVEEFAAPLYKEDWVNPELMSGIGWLEAVGEAKPYQIPFIYPVLESSDYFIYETSMIHELLLGTMTVDEVLKAVQAKADTLVSDDLVIDKYKKYFKE